MTERSSTPSIVPEASETVYLVLEDFGRLGRSWVETDEKKADLETSLHSLNTGCSLGCFGSTFRTRGGPMSRTAGKSTDLRTAMTCVSACRVAQNSPAGSVRKTATPMASRSTVTITLRIPSFVITKKCQG